MREVDEMNIKPAVGHSSHLGPRVQRHLVADTHHVELFGERMHPDTKLPDVGAVQAIDTVRAEDALLLHWHHGETLTPRWRNQPSTISGDCLLRSTIQGHVQRAVFAVPGALPVNAGLVETSLGFRCV